MNKKIGRREFFKKSAQAGISIALGNELLSGHAEAPIIARAPDTVGVAVATGDDYIAATMKSVEILGGIEKFVSNNAKVALLPNVQSRHPGAFTKPEILRGVLRLCKQAGATSIDCLSWQTEKQWIDTGLKAVIDAEETGLKIYARDESLFSAVPIPEGKTLKEAKILGALEEYDLFINMPVTKDHAGNKFTGTMKNLMGLNSPANNRTFHRPDWKTDPDDIAHLDQSIVDLNKAIKPALNIVDATEIITTNGPFGPGELLKPQKVVAGTDRVAVDAYCCGLWGLKPEEIIMIARGASQGLGTMDLEKAGVKEVKV